jgi:hypothetical protein
MESNGLESNVVLAGGGAGAREDVGAVISGEESGQKHHAAHKATNINPIQIKRRVRTCSRTSPLVAQFLSPVSSLMMEWVAFAFESDSAVWGADSERGGSPESLSGRISLI